MEGRFRIDVHGEPGTEYELRMSTFDRQQDHQGLKDESGTLGPDGAESYLFDYSYDDDPVFHPRGGGSLPYPPPSCPPA